VHRQLERYTAHTSRCLKNAHRPRLPSLLLASTSCVSHFGVMLVMAPEAHCGSCSRMAPRSGVEPVLPHFALVQWPSIASSAGGTSGRLSRI